MRQIKIWSESMRADVPCNGCRACCIGDLVPLKLDHGDRLSDHVDNVVQFRDGWYLKHKAESGECVYLAERGCALFGQPHRPRACLEMDCREVARKNGWKVKHGVVNQAVIDAAKRLGGPG